MNNSTPNNDIDLSILINALLQQKLYIVFSVVLSIAVGLYHVLGIPNYYTSSMVLVSEKGTGNVSGGLGKLTSLAGISMPKAGADKLSIAMKLLESKSFIGKFLEDNHLEADFFAAKAWDQSNNKVIYHPEVFNSNEWQREQTDLKSSKPTHKELTERFLNNHLSYKLEKESGFISISVTHISPFVARDTLEKLVAFINEESRIKAINTSEKKIAYLKNAIASTDNASMQTAFYDMLLLEEKDKMLASVNTEFVFTVLDPAFLPSDKAGPKRLIILIMFAFAGGFIGVLIALIKAFYFKGKRYEES